MSYQKFTQQLSGVQDWAKSLASKLTNKEKRIALYIAAVVAWVLCITLLSTAIHLVFFFAGVWWVSGLIVEWIRNRFPD
jgi:hypothetical protein